MKAGARALGHTKVAKALALGGGRALLNLRTPTTLGVRFPTDSPNGGELRYEHSLYGGAAGVGIALLDLAAATGDPRYVMLCDEVRDGLIESTPAGPRLDPALYSGHGGVALFHLARARLFAESDSLKRAVDLGLSLTDKPLIDTDVLGGAAGTGLLMLALHRATREDAFLTHALAIVTFLEETALPLGLGLAWPPRDPRQSPKHASGSWYDGLEGCPHLGLAHGTAGICLFLIELAETTRQIRPLRLAEAGFRSLDTQAVQVSGGLGWPGNLKEPAIQTHWCHGAAGISHAYLALYRHTQRSDALATAIAAGSSTWRALRSNPDEKPYHCHGLAGALELFLDLAAHGAGAIWRRRAATVVQRLAVCAHRTPTVASEKRIGVSPSPLGGVGAGLGIGAAGIVRPLLRFAGHAVFPILVPDRDRLRLDGNSHSSKSVTRTAASINSRPRRARRNFPKGLAASELSELIPPTTVRIASPDRHIVTGAPQAGATRATLRLLRQVPAGGAYFEALGQITRACRRLQLQYDRLLVPGILGPRSQALLLREVAGLALRPGADPRRVRRVARRMTANAIAALEMMLSRLAVDVRGALAREIGGRLADVEVHGGDPHRGGQRVVALRFESGPAFFYKPRSLAIDRELAGATGEGEAPTLVERCNGWLRPTVIGAQLPTHRLITAGPFHGYAERITGGDSATDFDLPAHGEPLPQPEVARLRPEDERRFWYSAGLLAGQAFALGIYDLHHENVIYGRSLSTPYTTIHAVDLELAFGSLEGLGDSLLVDRRTSAGRSPAHHSHSTLNAAFSLECGLYSEEWALEQTPLGVQLLPDAHQAIRWIFPHLAQNANGSFGFARHVCIFLRGFADLWAMVRSHAGEIAAHLRGALSAAPARVLCKPTHSYLRLLAWRKIGGSAKPGAAIHPWMPAALPLMKAELRQLDQLDVPYFFRFLGEENGPRPGVYWMPTDATPNIRVPELDEASNGGAFWSVVERQSDPERFGRAAIDAVLSVAPKGPFDYHDQFLSVRASREADDGHILIVVWLGERRDERLTFRWAPDGACAWWLHRRKPDRSELESPQSACVAGN